MNTTYTYFAFISYKHDGKDAKFANDLQRTLGEYKLPVSIVKKEPGLKGGVKPVFLDVTELGDSPTLTPAIKKALRESRFLIVICSPRSAKSEWVNKEIQYFVKLKRAKRIIPFIIEGCPNSKDENEECCTPTMKELIGERDFHGINISELGFEAAVVKVISRMFKVRFSSLWNIYEKEREKRQRELKEQNDELLRAHSRFVAAKANELIDRDDTELALRLLMEVLPLDINNPTDRPFTIEASNSFRKASIHNHQSFCLYADKTVFYSPDGGKIALPSLNTICVVSVDYLEEISLLDGHEDIVYSACFSPDGERVVSASMDKTIRVWDTKTRREICVNKGHDDCVTFASFSPNGNMIVSSSFDKTIRVWDACASSDALIILECNSIGNSVLFNRIGDKLLSAHWDGIIRIWDAKKATEIQQFEGHEKMVSFAMFSPDEKRIVSSSWDNTVRIWDVENGKQLLKIKHSDIVNSAVFDKNGEKVLTTCRDGIVRVWDSNSGMEIQQFKGHKTAAIFADYSPDGKQIVSTSLDGSVRIWDFPPLQDLINKTRERFKDRPLTPEERKQYYLE